MVKKSISKRRLKNTDFLRALILTRFLHKEGWGKKCWKFLEYFSLTPVFCNKMYFLQLGIYYWNIPWLFTMNSANIISYRETYLTHCMLYCSLFHHLIISSHYPGMVSVRTKMFTPTLKRHGGYRVLSLSTLYVSITFAFSNIKL